MVNQSCAVKVVDNNFDALAIKSMIQRSENGVLNLPEGEYLIDSPIYLPKGFTLKGKNVTLKLAYTEGHLLVVNSSGGSIEGIHFEGLTSGYEFDDAINVKDRMLLYVRDADNFTIRNCHFSNHAFTAVSIRNSSNVTIGKSTFSQLGIPYPKNVDRFRYSYDGVIIYTEPGYKSSSILIEECSFNSIGDLQSDDGDGIHILSADKDAIDNIEIRDSDFSNISRRGIKLQSGRKIKVVNCRFTNCASGVGITQAEPVSNVSITDNNFNYVSIALATNHSYTCSGVVFRGNEISNGNFGIRNSGGSKFMGVEVIDNTVKDLKMCFYDGIVIGGVFADNRITDYALSLNKSYYMAILLANKSREVIIRGNLFKTRVATKSVVYLQAETESVSIFDNQFVTSPTSHEERYLIYNRSKGKSNSFKKNDIIFKKNKK